jgi:hypothetical protein
MALEGCCEHQTTLDKVCKYCEVEDSASELWLALCDNASGSPAVGCILISYTSVLRALVALNAKELTP